MSHISIGDLFLNRPLMAALVAMLSSQVFKTLKPLARGRLPRLRDLSNYGGWPSSHTAFIVSCTAAVGLTEGFGSSLFAVSATVCCILVYDILKMRRIVAINSREVDRLLEESSMSRAEEPPQFEGHSAREILGGAAWGIAWALLVCWLWPFGA